VKFTPLVTLSGITERSLGIEYAAVETTRVRHEFVPAGEACSVAVEGQGKGRSMHDGIASDRPPVSRGQMKRDCKIGARFAYDSLSPEDASKLKRARVDILLQVSTTVKAIIEIGHQLLTVKSVLDRGQFGQWVETECDFSLRSAENFVRVARFVREKNATVANLSPTTLYLISARNAAPEFVKEVLALAATGATIRHADIVQRLDDYKSRTKEAEKHYELAKDNIELERISAVIEQASCNDDRNEVPKENVESERNSAVIEQASCNNNRNELVNANAQDILNRFGPDGVRFLLARRGNLMEALDVLEEKIGN
jgi:hypothetical protein